MNRFALIGDPLGHSLSPHLHKIIYRQLDIEDASYTSIELDKEQLPEFFTGFRVGGFDGINVTIPHKTAVLSLLDEIEPSAQFVGTVNCIHRDGRKLVGYNTDFDGFKYSLAQAGVDITGGRFAILGAGGSAFAVGAALADAQASAVYIVNRSQANAENLQQTLMRINPGMEIQIVSLATLAKMQSPLTGLINTTPVGMFPNQSASPVESLDSIVDSASVVFDLIYNPAKTQLLTRAAELGALTINGLEMLVAQAVYSVDIWMRGHVIKHVDIGQLTKEMNKWLARTSQQK